VTDGLICGWAGRLAVDLDAYRALLAGEPVDPARLDPKWLAVAKRYALVRLDVRAIDLFENWPTELGPGAQLITGDQLPDELETAA
jgi:hypothetical protein